jgi:hypothetical protein
MVPRPPPVAVATPVDTAEVGRRWG